MLQRCFKVYAYEAATIGLKNFSLNEISRCFLGKQKEDTGGAKVHELFNTNLPLLKKYNLQDTLLLKELDTKLKIISIMTLECLWTGTFLFRFYIGELLDNYILREAKTRKMVLRSKPSESTKKQLDSLQITGGYVAVPKSGLYTDVSICDFKSLYPSIIIGWNIGEDSLNNELSQEGFSALLLFLNGKKIETLSFPEWNTFLISEKSRLDPNDEHIQTANNCFFKRATRSFIGDLVEKLLDQRAEYKKKLKALTPDTPEYNNTYAIERVVKEMANSMFGITCDKSSRYFNQYVSEAITYTGQLLNKLSSTIADSEEGLTSIYGDTDSIFVVGSADLSKQIVEINARLKEHLDTQFRLRKNIVFLEYEKHFKKLLLLEKKRYTGLLNMRDGKVVSKIFSRGTEDVKKSNTRLGKQHFLELVAHLFGDEFSESKAVKYVADLRTALRTKEFSPEELLITTRVSKRVENYKVLSSHSRLAKRLIASGDLLPIVEGAKKIGTRLEYIMIDNHGINDGVLTSEYTGNFNREYYWLVQVFAPLKRLLQVVYPKTEWGEYDTFSDQLKLF